jgi:hypothetical protein
MKKTLLFTSLRTLMVLVFGLFFNGVWGQTSVQNFGTGTANHTSQTGSTGIIPNPTSGTTWVRGGATAPNAPISLLNGTNPLGTDGSYVRGTASSSGSVAKFSPMVGYAGSTEFYTSFKVIFGNSTATAAAATGSWSFYQGSGSMYSDANDLSSAAVCMGIRFTYNGAGNVSITSRQGSNWVTTGLTVTSLTQLDVHTVEIIGNNKSSGVINYTYNGSPASVAVQKHDLYIDGVLIGNDIALGGLSSGSNVNSTTFIGISSTSNAANIFVDDVVVYNAVPASIGAAPTSTTWDGTAWSNGTPTSSLDAIIAGNYSTGAAAPQGAFTAKSLTVNSGIFTVASGTSVTVENAIVNNAASSNFIVENNANLIQTNAVANTGSIKVKRNSNPLYRFDYTLWSSPLIGQNLKGFSSATLSNRFYTYNTATGTNGDYEAVFPTQSEGSYNFESGKGYLIRTPDSHPAYVAGNPGTVINAEFTGVPYNQSVNVALSNANTGFNLVGNPYPSAISIAQLFSSNSDAIDGTIWFWRKRNGASGSGYATSTGMGVTSAQPEAAALNPNGVINAGQGFFVKVKSGATQNTLNFSNALRSATTGGAFFRNANTTEVERHRIWLNLSNGTEVVGQTLLGYMTGATSGVDYGIEGSYFNDSAIAFTSYIENKEFAIQGRSLPFTSDDVVPMSFKTDVAGNYTIAIDHVDGLFAGSQEVFLKDNTTGQLHNLKSGAYSFASETGVFNNRFEIVYRAALGVKVPTISSNNIVAYKQNGSLVINSGNYVMENIELYDMSGRLIYTKNNIDASSAVIANLPIANQVLVVKITTAENGTANKKIVY